MLVYDGTGSPEFRRLNSDLFPLRGRRTELRVSSRLKSCVKVLRKGALRVVSGRAVNMSIIKYIF